MFADAFIAGFVSLIYCGMLPHFNQEIYAGCSAFGWPFVPDSRMVLGMFFLLLSEVVLYHGRNRWPCIDR